MVFTTSPTATFKSFTPNDIPYKDAKLSIFFETQEMMEDTLILLRYNCPDGSCDYIAGGWGDLKLHVRGAHGNLMWYECPPSTKSCFGSNRRQIAIFASGKRKYLLTNTKHILQTCYHITYHLFDFMGRHNSQKVSTSKFILCVSFVENASLIPTNCTHTCERNTKNVSSANEPEPCIDCRYPSWDV